MFFSAVEIPTRTTMCPPPLLLTSYGGTVEACALLAQNISSSCSTQDFPVFYALVLCTVTVCATMLWLAYQNLSTLATDVVTSMTVIFTSSIATISAPLSI